MKRDEIAVGKAHAYGSGRNPGDLVRRAICVPLSSAMWVARSSYHQTDDKGLFPAASMRTRCRSFTDTKGVLVLMPNMANHKPDELEAIAETIEVPEKGWVGDEGDLARGSGDEGQKVARERGWRLGVIPAQQIDCTWPEYVERRAAHEEAQRKIKEADKAYYDAESAARARVAKLVDGGVDLPQSINRPYRELSWSRLEAIINAALNSEAHL